MSPPAYRVVSIGTLAAHPLWNEGGEVRTGHATTTLITTGDRAIVVNPSLPPTVLQARLSERSRVQVDEVTDVFVTTFTVDHYRGLRLFERARWSLFEPERAVAGGALEEQLERARDADDANLAEAVGTHIELLERFEVTDEPLTEGVDLFPLPGVSPGTCGLLLPLTAQSVLVCGDAVATTEHLEEGKVLPSCIDVERAQESFREAIEIADVLVLGRDNLVLNPLRTMM